MLVLALSSPPVTSTRPSARTEIPGQNMSWPVSETVRWVTTRVTGSRVAVTVFPVPPKLSDRYDDHVRIFPSGSNAAATGTNGKPIGAPHAPFDGSTAPAGRSRLTSAALVQ